MKKLFKKALSSMLAVSMAVSLAPVQIYAEGSEAEIPAEEQTEEYAAIDESITYQGQNAVQSYEAEDGTVHTIYWAQGVTPPQFSGTPGEDGLYGDFKKVVEKGKNTEYITYQVPYEEGNGYYDMNKTNSLAEDMTPDNRCYLASASNLLYWWMEQNSVYIDQYVEDLMAGQKFQQGDGLVPLPSDPEGWAALRTAPELAESHNLYCQLLDNSNLITNNGPFSTNYNVRADGYFPDMVTDFFINGYLAINGNDPAVNTPDRYQKDPKGGFFYPVFGTTILSSREHKSTVDYYSQNVRDWFLDGKAMYLSYLTPTGAHAITLWGAEYDGDGEICRFFVTDSDDYENEGERKIARGMHSMNIIVDENNVVHLGNATNTAENPGAYINAIGTLDLAQDIWEAVTGDPEPEPGDPVVTEGPKSRNYGKGAAAEPLKVTAEVPEKDLDKGAYLTYQWYQADSEAGPGSMIRGAEKEVYTPQIGNEPEEKYYYCEVTNNKYGKKAVSLTDRAAIRVIDQESVNAAAPKIKKNIDPYKVITYAKGQKAKPIEILAESTDGGTLSYQWYRTYSSQTENGAPIKGQTTNQLTPPTNEISNGLFYYCEITNTNESVNGRQKTSVLTPVQRIKIVEPEKQEELQISNVPEKNPVYGEEFYLGTRGGSGSGIVTWEITDGTSFAEIEADTGKVTVKGVGSFTVRATKAGAGIFEQAQAELVVTSEKAVPQIGTVSISDKVSTKSTKKELEALLKRSNMEIPGTLRITDEKISLKPGSNTVSWLFTPADAENYKNVTGKVTFTAEEKQVIKLDLSGLHWKVPEELKYDGKEKTIYMDGTLPKEVEMTVQGTTKATDAGSYHAEASFHLKKGYDPEEYVILNGEPRSINWKIRKADGEKAPQVTGQYQVSSTQKDSFLFTIEEIKGAEYKMDGGNWQDRNTFDGIVPESDHVFYARIKETKNTEAGKEGHSTKIYFEKLKNEKVPEIKVQMKEKKDGTYTLTLEKTEGAEYSFDGGKTFGKENVKEGLKPGTTVETAVRYAETSVYTASEAKQETVQIPEEEKKTGIWKTSGSKWWYQRPDGTHPADQWEQIDGEWYHFDRDGWMQKGWLKLGNNWFYFNGSGHMVTGWQAIGGKWYYFYTSGRMLTGWQQIDGYWYYLKTSGEMTKGWYKEGSNWFYFNGSGHMVTGWQAVGGKWYYFYTSGRMLTGWQQIDGYWYYLKTGGEMTKGWLKIGRNTFYFNGSGHMVTGKQQINGKWYTFGSNGALQ